MPDRMNTASQFSMAHKKQNLPSKTCIVCGLDFNWRKKWARNWEDVKYCSEKCRRSKNGQRVDGDGSKK